MAGAEEMMAGAEEYLRPPVMDMSMQPVGGMLMLKALAMGAATIFEVAFAKWRHYKRMARAEREQEQRQQQQLQLADKPVVLALENNVNVLAIPPYSPGDDSMVSGQSSLAFNFEQLEMQEQQQQAFPQLLADLRELRQQLREQQQSFTAQLEQQKQQHQQHMQRIQLGMDERDQYKN